MSSALDQLTLAEFIASGAYDRHVRSMRLRYRRRRDQLVAALAQRAPGIRVTGMAAGLQAVLELPRGTERSVVAGGGPAGPGGQRDGGVPLRSGGLRLAVARAGRAGGQLRGALGQRVGGRAGRTVQGDAVDGYGRGSLPAGRVP